MAISYNRNTTGDGNTDNELGKIQDTLKRTNCAIISKGIVAPASTPYKVGDIYVDTVLAKVYIATGVTNAADWTILN